MPVYHILGFMLSAVAVAGGGYEASLWRMNDMDSIVFLGRGKKLELFVSVSSHFYPIDNVVTNTGENRGGVPSDLALAVGEVLGENRP